MAGAAFSGTAVIAATGDEVQVRATANTVKGGNIKAYLSNEGVVRIGPSGVTNDKTTTTAGIELAPGDTLPLTGGFEANIWYINGPAGVAVTFEFHV